MTLFHPEPMQHVSLFMRFDDAPKVSVFLANLGLFDPNQATITDNNFPDRQGVAYRRIFNRALNDWQKVSEFFNIQPATKVSKIESINKTTLLDSQTRLAEIWKICLQHKEKQRYVDKQMDSVDHLFKLLEHFSNLDIDLKLLKRNFEFLDVRLGIIPISNLTRLKQALSIEGYYLSSYLQETENAHIIVAGIKESAKTVQSLLDSASFQYLQIPDEFQEHPQIVYSKLLEKQKQLKLELNKINQEYQGLAAAHTTDILEMGNILTLAKPYAILSREMLRNGQLTEITGWVPKNQVGFLHSYLDEHIHNPVVIKTRHPKPDEFKQTPSYIARPQWLHPFQQLIRNYGVPSYREFEPSWFFTLSYILMFGIMFGDVGHGATIIFIGWLISSRWPKVFSFFVSIGLSSMLFGFIYGSIFAFEHVIPALWMSPMHDPMLMLNLALIWGISFIIFLNIVSIYNRMRSFQFHQAYFNANGIAGLILYLSILLAIYDLFIHQYDYLNLVLILLPIAVIFVYQWQHSNIQYTERFLVVLIETYEAIINYLSNTISFLRVAAFTLNHSALAIALFTLAGMTDGVGHWLAIILGNLFILILEGAIVGIQVLRLEYYEGFSRFFGGNGTLFKPLELSPNKLVSVTKT